MKCIAELLLLHLEQFNSNTALLKTAFNKNRERNLNAPFYHL